MTAALSLFDLIYKLLKILVEGTVVFSEVRPLFYPGSNKEYFKMYEDCITLFSTSKGLLVVLHGGPNGELTPDDHGNIIWKGWEPLADYLKDLAIGPRDVYVCACFNDKRQDASIDGYNFIRANQFAGPCFREVVGDSFVIFDQKAITIIQIGMAIVKRFMR